jgi:hypothetical protein
LGQSSYVSVGLVITLVIGAMFYGRQLQRLDAIESQLRDVSAEVRDIRNYLVRPTPIGR